MRKLFCLVLLLTFGLLGISQPVAANEESLQVGVITALSDTAVTVNDVSFAVNEFTTVEGEVGVGAFALVIGGEIDGTLTAYFIAALESGEEFTTTGEVAAISAESITVGTFDFAITPETVIDGDPQIGDRVTVLAETSSTGFVALSIAPTPEPDDLFLMDFITALTDDTVTIADQVVNITADTEISGELRVGAPVFVYALRNNAGTYDAVLIEVTDTQFVAVGTVQQLTADEMIVNDQTYRITSETEIVGDLAVGVQVFIVAEGGIGGATALYIEAYPETPPSETVSAYGEITAYSADSITIDSVDTFVISADTQLFGTPVVGDFAYVEGTRQADGSVIADYVEVIPPVDEITLIADLITAVAEDSVTIGEQVVQVTAETFIEGTLAVDTFAIAIVMVNGETLTGLQIIAIDLTTEGTVDGMTANAITVDGQKMRMNGQTQIDGEVTIGSRVRVAYDVDGRGAQPTARFITAINTTPTAVNLISTGAASPSPALVLVALLTMTAITVGTVRRQQ